MRLTSYIFSFLSQESRDQSQKVQTLEKNAHIAALDTIKCVDSVRYKTTRLFEQLVNEANPEADLSAPTKELRLGVVNCNERRLVPALKKCDNYQRELKNSDTLFARSVVKNGICNEQRELFFAYLQAATPRK